MITKGIKILSKVHKVYKFEAESVDSLTGEMYVILDINREIDHEIKKTEKYLTIGYDLKGQGHKFLGFRKTDEGYIHKIYPDQPELNKFVHNFIQRFLPEHIKELIPEQK